MLHYLHFYGTEMSRGISVQDCYDRELLKGIRSGTLSVGMQVTIKYGRGEFEKNLKIEKRNIQCITSVILYIKKEEIFLFNP